MKIILSLAAFIFGGFIAYGIGNLVYWIRKGPSLLVGLFPIFLAIILMGIFQSGGHFSDLTWSQVIVTAISLGMVSVGVYLFWSQESWG